MESIVESWRNEARRTADDEERDGGGEGEEESGPAGVREEFFGDGAGDTAEVHRLGVGGVKGLAAFWACGGGEAVKRIVAVQAAGVLEGGVHGNRRSLAEPGSQKL